MHDMNITLKNQRNIIKICQIVIFFSFHFCSIASSAVEIKNISEQQTFSFNFSNTVIKDVFSYIEKNSDYVFLYSNNGDVFEKVSLKVNNETIIQIMDRLSENTGINYLIDGKQVILKNKNYENSPQQSKKKELHGRITDASTNEVVAGASIILEGTTIGTVTDFEGNYSIPYPGGRHTVVVSFLGYKPAKAFVTSAQILDFRLEEDLVELEEAVVVGYGSQRKVSVIGAITTVNVDEIKVPTGQISNSLAGRLAGVVAVQRSGEPGKSSNFWVRGISTFGDNKNPLILVDGVERSLDLLDPEDIESFSILKDATATAVYGVRGANGVILVNTRRGKEGQPDVNVKIQTGILAPTKLPKMANSATWAEMYNLAKTARGASPVYTADEIEKYRTQSDPYLYPSVDWLDELMNNYATAQRVNLNVTGGGKIARYYVSGSFYNENGLFITDPSHEWDS